MSSLPNFTVTTDTATSKWTVYCNIDETRLVVGSGSSRAVAISEAKDRLYDLSYRVTALISALEATT